jgi:DNA polymerase IV
MHIDINSCFATIEQQANPFLRGKPVAVGAYKTSSGCILAASYEAKRLGVKTGMRVGDGRVLCPNLIILVPDADKYRFVHLKLRKLLNKYSDSVNPKSIDEFTVNFVGLPILETRSMQSIALEIKKRIKEEIGEWITVSIGISTNRYLAKTAASYRKPDGLFEINESNYLQVFQSLKLTDLCGIKKGNASRLATVNIFSVMDFFNAEIIKLKIGFHSVTGYYWYLRLHGYEVDDASIIRKSFGNSYALSKPFKDPEDLSPILTKLVEKMSMRLRRKKYIAGGIHLGILFRDYTYWHRGLKLKSPIFAASDFNKRIFELLLSCPNLKPVKNLAVTCFDLREDKFTQLELNTDIIRKQNLSKALDKINNRWGNFTIIPARMINNDNYVLDRVAFGGMSEI